MPTTISLEELTDGDGKILQINLRMLSLYLGGIPDLDKLYSLCGTLVLTEVTPDLVTDRVILTFTSEAQTDISTCLSATDQMTWSGGCWARTLST